MDEREIDRWLAEMAEDEAPLRAELRAAILDAAPRPQARTWWRPGLIWATPAAAALCGLWLGLAQPVLVLETMPGLATAESGGLDLLDDWEGWL